MESRGKCAALCPLVALAFAAALSLAPNASAQAVAVSTQPSLNPAFNEGVTDYVTRCTAGTPVGVSVTAGAGTEVDVDRQGPRTGQFTTSVTLNPGQAFAIVATSGPTTANYYVRCLPADFPSWAFERFGAPQVEWFTAAPFTGSAPGISRNYVAFYDPNGVPVWWSKAGQQPLDFHLLSNGNVVWTNFTAQSAEEHKLDGTLVRTITAVGPDAFIDTHETLLRPNGNYLSLISRVLPGFSFCGQSNLRILDQGYQEITPGGTVVEQWFASDHIPLTEIPAAWCNTIVNGPTGDVYDVYHVNSVEPTGSDFVLSYRHLDAAYRVSGTDGSVVWKLGGTARPERLTILNDPEFTTGSGFGGQHDARVLDDGTVTVFDNGFHPDTSLRHPPRAVRYAIDTGAGTATLMEQVNDPIGLSGIGCCGSARRLPGGDWLVSWGSGNLINELTPSGARVFNLRFQSGVFSYRSHPVMPGVLSRAALRAGMDAQFPRSYVRPKSATRLRVPLVPAAQQCVAPNRTHGAPLESGSCSPPASASDHLTVGTPDANGAATNSSGLAKYAVIAGDPSTPESEADVRLTVGLTDVRGKDDLSDYTGQLQVHSAVRITDRSGSTVTDTDFPATVLCTATASSTIGASCLLSSTFNAIVPGAVIEGDRANWEFGDVHVFDGGTSGVAGASDARLFVRQGVFVP